MSERLITTRKLFRATDADIAAVISDPALRGMAEAALGTKARMAVTTMDGLAAAIASGQNPYTYEASMTSKGAGLWQSLWTATGFPGAGSAPGAARNPTNATTGAIPLTNPSGSNTLYLARFACTGATVGTVIIYDRLADVSGLSGTSTSAQTCSLSLSRYTSGVGVLPWLEVYTATGSTAVTATISYTNQSGTSGRSGTCSLAATPVAGQVFPFTLASGDTGVQAVSTVTLSGSTGTVGNFGITLGYDLSMAPIQIANVAAPPQDFGQLGLPVVQNSACLTFRVLCSTTSTGILMTQLCLAQG